MSNDVWDRFETIAKPEEVETAKKQYEPLEIGDYESVLEAMEATTNKNGLPVIKGKFRTIEGNRTIFYNQNLQNVSTPAMTPVNIADAVNFISGLLGDEVVFTGMGAFAREVESLSSKIGEIFTINISYGSKDVDHKFPKLKVVKKPDAIDEGALPFKI